MSRAVKDERVTSGGLTAPMQKIIETAREAGESEASNPLANKRDACQCEGHRCLAE